MLSYYNTAIFIIVITEFFIFPALGSIVQYIVGVVFDAESTFQCP